MANGAHADDPVPALEMALAVPGKRRHPVTAADAEPVQGSGHRARAVMELGISDAVDRSVRRCRHHLGERVPFCCVGEKLVERQCIVLH